MNENRKNITSGDILEMMVRAGLKPPAAAQREEPGERRIAIVSIDGKDVEWHELKSGFEKDEAA